MAAKYSDRYMKRLVLDNGFVLVRSKGDHDIYKRGGQTVVLNKNINRMVAKRLEGEILGKKQLKIY